MKEKTVDMFYSYFCDFGWFFISLFIPLIFATVIVISFKQELCAGVKEDE